jgi:hypothetical protein
LRKTSQKEKTVYKKARLVPSFLLDITSEGGFVLLFQSFLGATLFLEKGWRSSPHALPRQTAKP